MAHCSRRWKNPNRFVKSNPDSACQFSMRPFMTSSQNIVGASSPLSKNARMCFSHFFISWNLASWLVMYTPSGSNGGRPSWYATSPTCVSQ